MVGGIGRRWQMANGRWQIDRIHPPHSIPQFSHTPHPPILPYPSSPNSPLSPEITYAVTVVGGKAAMGVGSQPGTRWRSIISPGFFIRRWLRLPGHCRFLKFLLPLAALRGSPCTDGADPLVATFELRTERAAREAAQNGQKMGMNTTAIPQKIRFSGTPTLR